MSEQNQGQEKSHEATPQKLERARSKGELARSQDAQAAAAYLGLAVALLVTAGFGAVHLGETLMVFLSRPDELMEIFSGPAAMPMALEIFGRILVAAAPVVFLPAVLILVLLVSQRAVVMAPDKLKPKLQRISPIANAKQKFGPHGLFEFVKSSVKLVAVSVVLALAILAEVDRLPGYVKVDARMFPQLLSTQLWNILLGVVILALAVAAIDVAWQRKQHLKKMRMTHQEVKDESKQSEGDPHMRASRRQRAREIASNRMLNDVPEADVVITNPEHYAVALKWNRGKGGVPVCVAKGTDELARRIRMRAEQAGVPIHPDPPTARSVHTLVEVGHPIMSEHYKAVAAAIVFADKLRAKARERSGGG